MGESQNADKKLDRGIHMPPIKTLKWAKQIYGVRIQDVAIFGKGNY